MRQFLTCIFIAYATLAQAQAPSLKERIEKAYHVLEKDMQMTYASASLTVLDVQTGNVIFSKNGNVGLAPASTLKTVTSATALQVLGPDHTFETKLAYTGTLSPEGILQGDLILIGGGDPSLGSWRYEATKTDTVLKNWVQAIQANGIKQIKGRVIADDYLYGTQIIPEGWIWQDIGNYYGGGATSLCWHENQFDVFFKPAAQVGDPVTLVRTVPAMPYLKLVNEVKTGPAGSGDKVYAYAAPYTDLVYLRGTYAIDLQKSVSPSIPDPAFDAAFRLADTLKQIGISTQQVSTWRRLNLEQPWAAANYHVIHTTTSPALSDLVYWFNQKSINLYGETFLKAIAEKSGVPIDSREAARFVKSFWQLKVGVDPNAINITDGSGLSPGDRVTTLSMAKILLSAKTETWFPAYYKSFPVYNEMKMKSGSIADVLAYAGYQTHSSGRELVFSFIINNYNGSTASIKQKMFKVLDTLK